jgi:hypothetical protein
LDKCIADERENYRVYTDLPNKPCSRVHEMITGNDRLGHKGEYSSFDDSPAAMLLSHRDGE